MRAMKCEPQRLTIVAAIGELHSIMKKMDPLEFGLLVGPTHPPQLAAYQTIHNFCQPCALLTLLADPPCLLH